MCIHKLESGDNSGALKMHAGVENAGVEKSGADSKDGKCRSGKCGSR